MQSKEFGHQRSQNKTVMENVTDYMCAVSERVNNLGEGIAALKPAKFYKKSSPK